MDSPPGSPLSEHSDNEFDEQEDHYHHNSYMGHSPSPTDNTPMASRPTKRKKTHHDRDAHRDSLAHATAAPLDLPDSDIPSDTDGSVPGSPHLTALLPGDDEEGFGHKGEQISFCRWDGCEAGELGNMDLLVRHLSEEHIHARQKKYACEWADCSRKGIAHASGYALRAHLRSHTREKPFYCTLPECDRSFTRSDALAKHMRTVHETEALRPSDPVPKHHSSNPQNKNQRIRLVFKASGANGSTNGGGPGSDAGKFSAPASPMTGPVHTIADEEYEHNNVAYVPAAEVGYGGLREGEMLKQFPPDVQFTDEELSLHPEYLYKLLRQQLQWASEDSEVLRREVHELEEQRWREWTSKELVLENMMEAEAVGADRRRPIPLGEDPGIRHALLDDVAGSMKLSLKGKDTPWWRQPSHREADNAAAMGAMPMEGVEATAA